ncbi:MAG: YceI family protein [Enhydrobacter sp.]|nr:YceI family protein [Enhydrobacter sp.]
MALAIGLSFGSPALAGPNDPWTIDPARSRIAFGAEQVGKLIAGRIASWTGTIVLDPENLADARIDIRMDMRSTTTGARDVDDMLKGKDFLDVARSPEARFVSDAVNRGSGDGYQARGKLTIREVTRDVTLPFTLRIENGQATARGSLGIKRLDYGVGRNEWAATVYVANEVTVDIAVVASRP